MKICLLYTSIIAALIADDVSGIHADEFQLVLIAEILVFQRDMTAAAWIVGQDLSLIHIFAAAHDKVANEHLAAIRSHCHSNDAAGILVGCQILVQVDLFQVKFSY